MKLPLIAACLVAGSTWSFANADVSTSPTNQKTASRLYTPPQSAHARGTQSDLVKSNPAAQKNTRASKLANSQQGEPQKRAQLEARELELKQSLTQAQAQQQAAQQQAALRAKQAQPPVPHPFVVAAPPADDDCSTPTVIVGTGLFNFDNTGATTGVDGQTEPICTFYGSTTINFDIWYQWVAPSSGTATMTFCSLGTIDTKVAAYAGAGCPAPGTALACDDDFCGFPWQSQIAFPVTAGSTYTLQIGNYPFGGGTPGAGQFTLNVVGAAPLDDCSMPAVIAGVGAFPFDTTGMTTSPQQGFTCGPAGQDMWFEWTAPSSGMCLLDTCGTGWDTLVKAYAGAGCPAGGSLACNDDSICGGFFTLQSNILFPVTAGSVYMLQIGGYGANFGPGVMNLAVLTPPANDDCSTPTAVVGYGTFPFDNTVASTGVDGQTEANCLIWSNTGVTFDVWYTWTAPVTEQVSFDTCGLTGVDTKIAVYAGAGCPVAGTSIGCDDDSCGLQSRVLFNAVAGTTYTLQVGTYPWGAPGGVGSFELVSAPPPPNDDCGTATAVAGYGVFPFDNTIASTSVDGQTEILCNIYSNTAVTFDVWYAWTAPATEQVAFDTCGLTGVDTKIAVYAGAGCPAPGTALACDDDACGLQSQVLFNAVAGSTYMLQLGTWPYGAPGGVGNFQLFSAPAPANDDCLTPDTLVGVGSFPFDNTFATTGVDGQAEGLCLFFGSTTVAQDVWFQWTAPSSGCTIIDTCGSFIDTKVAVYAGTGCPVAGSALDCNDDACGLQSKVLLTATAGTTYTIQLGLYPFATGGAGFLNITQPGAAPGSDNCATPTVIVGTGVFPFDNSACTSGCEGQSEAICTFYGTTAIDTDEWFQWTAPSSGVAVMTTCGSTIDTKVAAYLGAGCPTPGSSVACADDSCPGFASTIVWNATAGTTYMIQIGTWPFGAPPGAGFFDLNILTPPGPCDALDDNTTENLWSLGGNSDVVWLNRFGEIGVTTTINSIDVMYGSAMFPGFSMPNGTPTDVLLYGDGVSQDGDPSDATLLAQIPSVVSNVDLDTYVNVPLVTPVTVTGYFFAGAHEICPGGVWVAPEDTQSVWIGRSWEFGNNTGGVTDLTNPGANAFPPTLMGTGPLVGFTGTFCVRVNCSFGPATYTCTPGDPGINLCPCANPPTGANRGCNNKDNTGGASITGTGSNSLATPTLAFTTANENATVGSVLLQGTAFNPGINFGHGVRCSAGILKRLYVKIAVGGSITAPGVGDPSIPAKSASLGNIINAGETRYYQVYYRDTTVLLPGCPVPANQFNVTNTGVVVWQP